LWRFLIAHRFLGNRDSAAAQQVATKADCLRAGENHALARIADTEAKIARGRNQP
jgi:hypothetical protein